MLKKINPILLSFLLVFSLLPIVIAESVESESSIDTNSEALYTSLSSSMANVIFDGQWSNKMEWKESTLQELFDPEYPMILRIAHYDGYLYIHMNNLFDLTNHRSADRSIACLSSIVNDEHQTPMCFVASRGITTGHVLIGNSISALNGGYKIINISEHFEAVGNTSSETDRYMLTPHAVYEFKIPLSLFEESQNYKIFLRTIDNQNVYSYPEYDSELKYAIPPVSMWADLSSKDKSLHQ